ncbi:DNA-cytosine methyltransferase [Candidatus Giovannonibacteria bacterium RIFCSPHIGHO2_01_FULL_45_24]|uniref:DNA-cytosine methyltransferase n=1 Tax=Candidatus Giovannonibacteria bacterium RIFCSPLOWO2_01_FULL_46_32 TaxID=1798353 RepID=A0A1F5XJ94_9BACT|nr:MAG: DNA-cytosine methyltransferase [Candidatus Giovannonibacteria bacterium RIFCSPHIGHO2_01_FULL_45_24]OGF87531.1 MAG: DNA-cytosine methyltransferase [Candidatus Giovannonibacteria bacterium RIFCSPLOWO2_01_FULL_46_32]
MKFVYNNQTLKSRRKELRKSETDSERLLWKYLRNKRFYGIKFLRQYSVGPYILDFYCPDSRLAIELDGGGHTETDQKIYDRERTSYLRDKDIKVIRFWNTDVLKNTEAVLEKIKSKLKIIE